MRNLGKSIIIFISKYYSIFVVLLLWEIIVKLEFVNPFLLPSIFLIIKKGISMLFFGELLKLMGLSLYRAITSFVLAIFIGVPVGILMARLKLIRWFFDPIISIGFPTPKISFLPIFVLWFGIFDLSKIMLAFFASSFPIITSTYHGTIAVDKYLIWSAENMGTSRKRILWRIIAPAALPQIFSGIQIAMPLSLMVIIVTEMATGGGGLGGFMMLSSRYAETVSVFVSLITISILGYLIMKTLERCRKFLLKWHEETR